MWRWSNISKENSKIWDIYLIFRKPRFENQLYLDLWTLSGSPSQSTEQVYILNIAPNKQKLWKPEVSIVFIAFINIKYITHLNCRNILILNFFNKVKILSKFSKNKKYLGSLVNFFKTSKESFYLSFLCSSRKWEK